MAQDRHYPAAASKVYSQALVKASSEGPAVFAMVREMLEDCHEELSLHAHYTEVCDPVAKSGSLASAGVLSNELLTGGSPSCLHDHA